MPPRKPLRALIVAAYATELAGLVALGRKHFIIKKNIAYLAAGIGPVAASFGLTHFLEDHRPEIIIGIGTAGIINTDEFSIGDVVCAKSVTTEAGTPDAYTPRLQCARLVLPGSTSPNPSLQRRGSTYARHDFSSTYARTHINTYAQVQIFSPQEITRTESRRQALAAAGHDVENLEAFAIAYVAKKFRLPCQMILGLTNIAGAQSHTQWRRNATSVMKKVLLARAFQKFL